MTIILFSGIASARLLWLFIVPAFWRGRAFPWTRYALGIGSFFAMLAHFEENIVFGLGRFTPGLDFLLTDVAYAMVGKVLIVLSAVFTVAGLTLDQGTSAHDGTQLRLSNYAVACVGVMVIAFAAYYALGVS